MIDIDVVRGYFPAAVRANASFEKHILKEYLQLMILDFLSSSAYASRLSFIGGTCLRLVYGIDRFSEDLDFDCKDMTEEMFMKMTDDVMAYLRANDFSVEARDKANPRLTAFRRNIYFPGLLFEMNMTGHREERFLIKVEAQDQGVAYEPVVVDVKGCGFFFPLQSPPKGVLCAMKLAALLSRGKGRDFYDAMFLLSQTEPDYCFLNARCGVGTLEGLKARMRELLSGVDLERKAEDFKHLLFNIRGSGKILRFGEFVDGL
ncbi:MAG: nucleotidyl transferase AbiEii/AbiGii toxin family protein [Bacteroidaceae bacterium]|nr:nucleotidyl transferase AbiEii/AbiGii toxin family protein [Bacteroidaceae bacterium]